MFKRFLGVVAALVFISGWAGCHTHDHDCHESRKRDGVHVRAPYTKVDVTWSDDDDDDDVEVDVDVDD